MDGDDDDVLDISVIPPLTVGRWDPDFLAGGGEMLGSWTLVVSSAS